jgi:hypothetical protein
MIRRLGLAVLAGVFCVGLTANAADLPSIAPPKKLKIYVVQAKAKLNTQKPAVKPVAVKRLKTVKVKSVTAARKIVDEPDRKDIDLVWVLDPLVASADGSKKEGSAGIDGNLIVTEPGFVASPDMVIELSGHIVKTAGATARLDVSISGKNHQVNWKVDDVEAGTFVIELNARLAEGRLPAYFPVSALAFATKTSKGGVAMVSLEKVRIRLAKAQYAQQQ